MKRKNGNSFMGSLSLWRINDKAGKPAGMVGYTLDITETVKAEEEVLGKSAEDFFFTEYEKNEIMEILKDKGFKSERRARKKDGTMPVWLSTSTIKDSAGKHVAYMGSVIDIIERK
jgi:hypothetical protein